MDYYQLKKEDIMIDKMHLVVSIVGKALYLKCCDCGRTWKSSTESETHECPHADEDHPELSPG